MLSILGGDWSGRKLAVPDSDALRPSAGRVKACIFSVLESYRLKSFLPSRFEDCRVLDLFAGVGGLGLEALSRGAAKAVFVEKDRRHAQFLKDNIRTLKCEADSTLLIQPVDQLSRWHALGPFHLVFLDPPYALEGLPSLLTTLQLSKVLAPGAIVVFEHGPSSSVDCPPEFTVHSERKLGPAGLSVFLYRAG